MKMVHKLQVGEPLQKKTCHNQHIYPSILQNNNLSIAGQLLGINKDACFCFNVLHQTVISVRVSNGEHFI